MSLLDPRRRRRSTLVLLVLTSITLISLDYQGFRPLEAVQSAARSLIDPVANSADSITSPFTNAWKSFTDFDDMEAENQQLREDLAALQGDAIRASAAEESLRSLLEELQIDYVGGAERVVAQVIDRPGNFESDAIEIDRGSDDGIRDGMPVVTSAGLIGRVTEVASDFSQVRLVEQDDFPIGVRVVGLGEVALARGQGPGEPLKVTEGLTDQTEIQVGQQVVTSGIQGSSYPPDIVVGVVSEVVFDSATLELDVRIRPVADLESLRYVTVILWTVDGEQSS